MAVRIATLVITGLLAGVLTLGQSVAVAQSCYDTTIKSPTPFMGNDGEILKAADGSVWEVKNAYNYFYAYYPSVVLCPSRGKLIINNKTIDVLPIASGEAGNAKDQAVIESTISSDFEGLAPGNIYKLANGQVWEQVEPWVWLWIWINPKVLLYPAADGYKM
jgi:hypothetical protein